MKKGPITITATTLGRAKYNPDYYQREYLEVGDIPNHIAAILAFIREDLKPNEKIVVKNRKIYVVEKTTLDKFVDWVAGRRQQNPVNRPKVLSYLHNPVLNPEG